MKKIFFIPTMIFAFSVLSFAQNDIKKTTELIEWRFSNNTGQPVDGIMIEMLPIFKIEKGSIESIANSQPVIVGAPVTSEQKLWLPCNFRLELGKGGIVKFDVQKTGLGLMDNVVFQFYWFKNGQRVGNMLSAKTDAAGNIKTTTIGGSVTH